MRTETEYQASAIFVPKLDMQSSMASSKPQRIHALDFTKGALVLLMVLYHWINYFIGPNWEYYEYLRFLTPSFIFITGFMISNVYLSKYAVADPRLPKRLFTRGLKLMAVFLVLNSARSLIVPALGTGAVTRNPFDSSNLFAIFVSGNFGAFGIKLVAFSILVPISYLLMLSGALILPYRSFRYTFHVVFALLLLSIMVLALAGMRGYDVEFVAIGMLGLLTGFMSISAITNFIRRPIALGFAYLLYLIAITVWNVPFPLLVAGVLLSLMVIFLLGASGGESGPIRSRVILLGRYSLFGYISQIAILQILAAGFHHFDLGIAGLIMSFIAAFSLNMLSVEAVDRARGRAEGIDRLYRAVFA